jgi:hypothetical protein
VVLRTRDEFAALFGPLDLVDPGIVQLPDWRPELGAPPAEPVPMWCGVGRKTARRD